MRRLYQFCGRTGDLRRLAGLFLLVTLLAVSATRTFARTGPSEYAVKGAFLFNFAKFVQWPAGTFTDSSSPIVIGIFGHDPSQGEIETVIGSKTVDGRSVVVRIVSSAREAQGVQILFVPVNSMGRIGELSKLKSGATLIVGETESFAHKYGDIGFIPDGARLGFEINSTSAKSRDLTISSKLLRLAKWVG